jgi:16S rRNA (cytosine967-C5)-methyltransferase
VLDTCSAPGGKAFASALRMNNKGSILACDIHEKKLGLIQRGAEKLGIDIIKTRARDAREYDSEMDSQFDLVIADVPCSGIGVIRKKPEIRARKESEIANLPAIQLDILCNAAKAVKPGGALLYSTCTVLRDENESVVERFLEINNSFALSAYALGEETVENGMRTFWPNVDGTDGFFAARLIRKK